jgi:GAF domain-containing protein
MQCPRCQHDNPAHAKFCLECSEPFKGAHESGPPVPSYADLQHALSEALEQQTATSEILRVISSSPTDLQPVFDTIVRSAGRLCNGTTAAVFLVRDGTLYHPANYGGSPEALAAARARYPRPLGVDTGPGIAILTRSVHEVSDVEDSSTAEHIRAVGRVLGFRSVITVPMLRRGEAIGAIAVTRREPGPFSEGDTALLQTFADQAVIAIENARLLTELQTKNADLSAAHAQLTEALEQQTVTAEILRVISSSPTSVETVFDTILASALRLCDTPTGGIFTFDGRAFHIAAAAHWSDEFLAALREAVILPGLETPLRRVGLNLEISHVADIFSDPSFSPPETYRLEGMRTSLAVPMLKEGRLVGALTFHRREVRPFTEAQIALIKIFADQAVIAIENVRLFKELQARNRDLSEALEQQTATAEVLRVISSSPTDLQPVLDTVVRSAARFCGAYDVCIFRLDGDHLRLDAHHGPVAQPDGFLLPVVKGSVGGRTVLEQRVIHVADLPAETAEFPEAAANARRLGFRTILSVPLVREGVGIGAIQLRRPESVLFTDKQVSLLQTFADQAVIAIENVRLFTELQTRNREITEALEQQTATSEILRVISSSPTDVRPVFDTIVRSAVRLLGGFSGVVTQVVDGQLHLAALTSTGPSGDAAQKALWPKSVKGDRTLHGHVITALAPHLSSDIESDPSQPPTEVAVARARGYRSIVAVPLLRDGRAIGSMAVTRRASGPFADGQITLLQTFADQAVIAIENVRLFTELQEKNQALTQAHGQVTEALEQQTATAEILKVISQSPTDAQPVFDTIVQSVVRLCDAVQSNVQLFDGELMHWVAQLGIGPEAMESIRGVYPMRPDQSQTASRAVLTRSVVHLPDVLDDPEYRHELALKGAGGACCRCR